MKLTHFHQVLWPISSGEQILNAHLIHWLTSLPMHCYVWHCLYCPVFWRQQPSN